MLYHVHNCLNLLLLGFQMQTLGLKPNTWLFLRLISLKVSPKWVGFQLKTST